MLFLFFLLQTSVLLSMVCPYYLVQGHASQSPGPFAISGLAERQNRVLCWTYSQDVSSGISRVRFYWAVGSVLLEAVFRCWLCCVKQRRSTKDTYIYSLSFLSTSQKTKSTFLKYRVQRAASYMIVLGRSLLIQTLIF